MEEELKEGGEEERMEEGEKINMQAEYLEEMNFGGKKEKTVRNSV